MTQMRQRPAGEAGRGDVANVRAGQAKHTTRPVDSASFILPIDDGYRLTADERCWRIEQRRKDSEWRPVEWHSTLEAAVNSLSGRLLRTSEVRTLADALAAVETIARKLARALAPTFKVEARP